VLGKKKRRFLVIASLMVVKGVLGSHLKLTRAMLLSMTKNGEFLYMTTRSFLSYYASLVL
jgi:hypothetical protein